MGRLAKAVAFMVACLSIWPSLARGHASDQSASVALVARVEAAFSIEVSGDVDLSRIPSDGVAYSQAGSNTVRVVNNEDAPWYVDVRVNAVVPGAVLEYLGGDQTDFTPLTSVGQRFHMQVSGVVNTPYGADYKLSYRARTDGSLQTGTAVAWSLTYTLAQGP